MGGGGASPTTHPPTPLKEWAKFSSRPSADQKFSSVPSAPLNQHHLGGGGGADTQTAHHATSSTASTHQRLGSANAETTPARAPAAAADRKQRPDATREGENG